MNHEIVLGIDLGTTNSCCAYVDQKGKVQLIPYKDGTTTIPSIFACDDHGRELIGQDAKRQSLLNPRRTVIGSKRLMGKKFDEGFKERMKNYFSYELNESSNGQVGVLLGASEYSLMDVSAKILTAIKSVASDHLNKPIEKAVVTVPAYFNDLQRQSVKKAAEIAGIEIIKIINEPTAAALAYGLNNPHEKRRVAIYDLGGGTFDISIIDIRGQTFEVLATGGDIFLGGLDFDYALIDFLVNDFNEKNSLDLRTDPIAMQRLKDLVERTKIDLSSRNEVPFSIPFITMTSNGMPLNLETIIKRDHFETLCRDLVMKTIDICRLVFLDANLSVHDVDELILVGGQTRMPLVQNVVKDFFGKEPSKSVNPDEAVAIGAARYAHALMTDAVDQKIYLLDVIPMNIGIEKSDGMTHVIFKRNSAVPNQKTLKTTTAYDNQDSVKIRIVQGDFPKASDNTLLGEFNFYDIPKKPAKQALILITFSCSVDGLISLNAIEQESGRSILSEFRLNP